MSRAPTTASKSRTVMFDLRHTAVRGGHRSLPKVRTPEVSIVAESGVSSLSLYPGLNVVDAELLAKHQAQKGWAYANSVHKLETLPEPDALAEIIDRSWSRGALVHVRGLVERAEYPSEQVRTSLIAAIDARLALNLFEAPQVPYVAPPSAVAAANAAAASPA